MYFLSTGVFSLAMAMLTAGSSIRKREDVAYNNMWKNHDLIKPFQQTEAEGMEGQLEERFKPWVNAISGCWPYAAVDSDGYHGGGVKPGEKSRSNCRDTGNQGGQMYVRVGTSNNRIGILYSLYIPKVQTDLERHRHFYLSVVVWIHTTVCNPTATDYQPAGITYSLGSGADAWDLTQTRSALYTAGELNQDATHPIVAYDGQVNLFPARADKQFALSPPMISWSQLPTLSKEQFNGIVYEHARCPFTDGNFEKTLNSAYAANIYADVKEPECANPEQEEQDEGAERVVPPPAVPTPTRDRTDAELPQETTPTRLQPTTTDDDEVPTTTGDVNTDPVEDGDVSLTDLPADPTFTPSPDE